MILKQDLQKAYDRLELPFLMETLRMLNLSDTICFIIHHCVSSASVSINWNGDKTSSISTSRGIRQDDPISPYIFILALERLSHRINNLVNSGVWNGFKFGRGDGLKVSHSHICFVDHLILVAKGNSNQMLMIKEVLEEFCNSPGPKVNLSKPILMWIWLLI